MNWQSSSQRSADKLGTPDIFFYQELVRTLSIEAGESWMSIRRDPINSCNSDSSTTKYSSTTTTCSSIPICDDPVSSPSASSTISNASETCGNKGSACDLRQYEISCVSSEKADLFFRQELEQIGAQPDNLLPYEPINPPTSSHNSLIFTRKRTKMPIKGHFSKTAIPRHVSASNNIPRTASWPTARFEGQNDQRQQSSPALLTSPNFAASDDTGEDPEAAMLSNLTRRSSFRNRLPPGKMGLLFTDAAHSVLTNSFIKRVSP